MSNEGTDQEPHGSVENSQPFHDQFAKEKRSSKFFSQLKSMGLHV